MKLNEETWARVYPWLDKAQDVPAALGYKDADSLMKDDDLKSLRADARFSQLVERLRKDAVPPAATP